MFINYTIQLEIIEKQEKLITWVNAHDHKNEQSDL